jgi:hypothetical protein
LTLLDSIRLGAERYSYVPVTFHIQLDLFGPVMVVPLGCRLASTALRGLTAPTAPRGGAPMPPTKQCSACACSRPTADFGRRRVARDGLQSWCRQCQADYGQAYRQLPRVKQRHAELARARGGRPESKQKTRARAAVAKALRAGVLLRPTVCSQCRTDPGLDRSGGSLIYADHHQGYEPQNWANVRWICSKCDHAAEGKNRGVWNARKRWGRYIPFPGWGDTGPTEHEPNLSSILAEDASDE